MTTVLELAKDLETQISILSGLPSRSEVLSGQSTVIGRVPEANLVLNHPEVSRRHCRIFHEHGTWFVEDLGSRRGTAVNGKRISGRIALRPCDQIHVGLVTLAFGVGSEEVSTIREIANPIGAVLYKQQPTDIIPLNTNLVFGRGDEIDVDLDDPVVSRRHAMVEVGPNGYRLVDLRSPTGSFVNGRRFEEHDLIIGDKIQLGPFFFTYDGRNFHRIRRTSTGRIVAIGVTKESDSGPILVQVNFRVEPGQFIGILGPSGAGKSTLLNVLSGLRPAESGKILVDNTDLYKHLDQLRPLFGYVPQDDIVHSDLTVIEALTFAARLRLLSGTPRREIVKLVNHTVANLGLSERANLRINRLSGGQRKRVSVGVELLGRPPILFLDEPTSGLDPLAEFKVIELLRGLADNGCTVVCTTHVMENVFLMDQIAVMSKGRVVFQGPSEEALHKFGVSRLTSLFAALQAVEPTALPCFEPALPGETEQQTLTASPPAKPRTAFSLPILLQRQVAIFRADIKNLIMLLAQPIGIGLLVAWATDEAALTQFYINIATLWFGANNSAQEIVRELPIYRRERLVGLSRLSYLASKFLWMGGLTAIQSLLLYALIAFIRQGTCGSVRWQVIGLILLALASTGIGLTISAFARSVVQAVMLVPLFLIPQIVFSGFSPPAYRMAQPVLSVSQIMPSFASQRIGDVSLLLDQKITFELFRKYPVAYENIDNWYQSRNNWSRPKTDESLARERLKNGTIYTEKRPIWVAYISLISWTFAAFVASFCLLAKKERE